MPSKNSVRAQSGRNLIVALTTTFKGEPYEMDIARIIAHLTLSQKIALVEGHDSWHTFAVPENGIRALTLTDGPHGLRMARQAQGGFDVDDNEESTAFPTSATVGSSWNPAHAYAIGRAIAQECVERGVDVLLAPGINIKRNPLCGRNFEYYSEDPLLSGAFGSQFVQGVQSRGVGCAVKHFAANSNENYRFVGDSQVDERALREIYMRAFERVVRQAHPYAVMTSYNKVNGVFASENASLLRGTLRQEWGFDGLVMTDWGGTHDRVASMLAGCDLDMPGGVIHNRILLAQAIRSGEMSMDVLDRAVGRVLLLGERASAAHASRPRAEGHDEASVHSISRSTLAHNEALALEVAKDSAVLLANDGTLPLKEQDGLLVVGEMFEKLKFQGAGSSLINPPTVVSPRQAFDRRSIRYSYAPGYRSSHTKPEPEIAREALRMARKATTILVFAGLTDFDESEGFDRESMALPEAQRRLIEELLDTGKPVVLVLFAGAPVELPFADRLRAILDMYLPGMAGGEAAAALLLGEESPRGKLTESWLKTADDSSSCADYDKDEVARYYETIYVGYRCYDKAGIQPLFHFGHGLSYTAFSYADLHVSREKRRITVNCTVKNIGDVDASEVVQLYSGDNHGSVFKAERELRAFAKVRLRAGESARVSMGFSIDDLSYWNVREHRWVCESGEYPLMVGAASDDIRLSATLTIDDGELVPSPYSQAVSRAYAQPPRSVPKEFEDLLGRKIDPHPARWPVTMESRLLDFRHSPMGRILYRAILGTVEKNYRTALKMPDSLERDSRLKNSYFIVRMMPYNSPRSMCMSSSGAFSYSMAKGFPLLANGHLIAGVRTMLAKEHDPIDLVDREGTRS